MMINLIQPGELRDVDVHLVEILEISFSITFTEPSPPLFQLLGFVVLKQELNLHRLQT